MSKAPFEGLEPGVEEDLERLGRFYAEQGFAIAWTASNNGDDGAKRVTTRDWQHTKPLADPDFAAGLFKERGKTRNPAIVLRPSGLVAIECDGAEDLAHVEELGLPPTLTARSSAPDRQHRYFRPPAELETLPYVAFRFEAGELTADSGRYFVAPPALHPSGAVYSFLPGLGPDEVAIAEMPEALYLELCKRARRAANETPAAELGERIPQGRRRNAMLRVAGKLKRSGLTADEILPALRELNKRCDPPLDEDELRSVAGRSTIVPAEGVGGDEQASAGPFPVVDLDAFLTSPPAEPPWDWRGWFARGDVVLVAGDPGVGKSLGMLAIAVAALEEEREVIGEAVAKRRGLYCDLENPEDVAYTRLHGFGLRGNVDGFAYVHRPADFNLRDSEGIARLRATILAARAELVVVDSLRRAAPGLDENDSREVSIVFTALRDLARELDCTIIVVHHPRKPVGGEKVEALYAARGSGDLTGSVDSYLFFRKLSGGLVRIEHGKARRGREHDDVCFRVVEGDAGEPVIEHVEVPHGPEDEELYEAVVAYVNEHPGEATSTIENEVEGARRRIRDALERGASENVLAVGPGRARNGRYWYPADHAASGSPGDHGATEGEPLFQDTAEAVLAGSPDSLRRASAASGSAIPAEGDFAELGEDGLAWR